MILGGGRLIETYPLAVASERSITGQSFDSLEPGESIETIFVSDRLTEAKLPVSLTWRIKLRVAPVRSEIVGVEFRSDEVR